MIKFFNSILISEEKKSLLIIIFCNFLISIFEILTLSFLIPIGKIFFEDSISTDYKFLIFGINIFHYIQFTDKKSLLTIVLKFFFLFQLIKYFCYLIFYYFEESFLAKLFARLNVHLFTNYLNVPFSFHTNNNSSLLLRNMTSEFSHLILGLRSILGIFTEILLVISIIFFMLLYSFETTIIIILIFAFISFLLASIAKKYIDKWSTQRQSYEGLHLKILLQGFNSVREIILTKSQNYFAEKFFIIFQNIANVQKKLIVIKKLPKITIELFFFFILMFVAIFFENKSSSKETYVYFGIFAFAAIRSMPSVYKILYLLSEIKSCGPSIKLLEEQFILTNKENLIYREQKGINLNYSCKKNIKLENLFFRYPNSSINILDNINLNFSVPNKIAIIGDTGSGKTTLINAILGLIRPSDGKILSDNVDININCRNWFNLVSYVPQNILLLDETIKNNILFGVHENKINNLFFDKALEVSQLNTFVENLPLKENTFVGEFGIRISGGQRQRIAIARAIYQNKKILILDEGTNALDEEIEKKIIYDIFRIKKDSVIILVTHNLRVAKMCDAVYKLSSGKLKEIKL